MKSNVPQSEVVPGHPDYELLSAIEAELDAKAGGRDKIVSTIPANLREEIDVIIQTPRTGRKSYDELEKTEKTYIGTRVEILLRDFFKLKRGRLDAEILGYDVDIKHTMGSNWMIPGEALGSVCIVVAADEDKERCYMGLVVARPEYLRKSDNQDKKGSFAAASFKHILWLFREQPYPANFWRHIPAQTIETIFAGKNGNERVIALFTELQEHPVPRATVNDVARQVDFTRRIRADQGRGTRNRLAANGILLLSKTYNGDLIRLFNLPEADFVSYSPKNAGELAAARKAGYDI